MACFAFCGIHFAYPTSYNKNWGFFAILVFVRRALLAIAVLLFAGDLTAQVIFRNDFVINAKERKLKNRGITSITINLGRFPNWNQLINGRGGRTMVIDVRQITQKKVVYTHSELAERIYMPAMFTGPVTQRVPVFLLMGPPHAMYPAATFRGLNLKLLRPFQNL
jgi:hypothetical protein